MHTHIHIHIPGSFLPLGQALEPPALSLGAAVVHLSLGFLESARVLAGREVLLEHDLVELRRVLGHLHVKVGGLGTRLYDTVVATETGGRPEGGRCGILW